MILEYQRPDTIEEAIRLVQRAQPKTLPLGGGTVLSRLSKEQNFAVVDLQNLKMGKIIHDEQNNQIGATVSLENWRTDSMTPAVLAEAIRKDVSGNLRQQATAAGTICSADGLSRILTVLLAMDARVVYAGGTGAEPLNEFLSKRNNQTGYLITSIQIPNKLRVVSEEIVKTPEDRPLLVMALGCALDGTCRLSLGCPGSTPQWVLTTTQKDEEIVVDEKEVIKIACSHSSTSNSIHLYYSQIIPTLLKRMKKSIGARSL